ncbi:Hsp20/alpha crystallin family protein [Tissierella praeacuta]|uniref:HSP20 family protein n=1 Tax=Tissierella praeacuta DSM 18095 TaxID=1123404 RepID=A0A1M4SRR5_9FIRM|nr:Hsp20/alpha crystallin family protein [Tissierella praeacuta]MBU5254685.1 Hsp20/alpha crystallin family protein [Tissierella praeacuta]TCU70658.1 HSP20 family protein [Tissierella praeacuta]SHE34842.1 HSP20 family protein [Tissierella praeacuta DSM 18095]SUP01687.1 T786P28D [Tissierella praeacuta]
MAGLVPFNRRNSSILNTGFEDFYNMLDDFFNNNWSTNKLNSRDSFKIDIQEDDKEYIVEANLPGVKKEEINIELNDGKLKISVKRDETINEEKKNYVYKESRYCSMSRSVYLADSKSDGVKAKLDNGILYITIPKEQKANNTKIIEIE